MNEKLITFLQDHIAIELDFGTLLEKPKHESHGDFSLPCFLIAN